MLVWGELMGQLAHEPLAPPLPENVELVPIDPRNGLRAGFGCSGAIDLPFVIGTAPSQRSPCAGQSVPESPPSTKSWWRRLFD
jgi:penicillin-binding protein 1B